MATHRRNVFFLLFALSGFSGLIYESIWSHYLKLFLGHAAYSQTLVLAIFMGGMAAGSWICSKYSPRWKSLLLGYASAEGAIGLFALFFHEAFDRSIHLAYTHVLPLLGSAATVNLFKWALSALMILPQSILLGMTFPLMSAGILRLFPQQPGRSVAMLYFTNSIGAALGVLVSGFFLIRLAGLPGTMRIAGLLNLALALIVWRLVRGGEAACGGPAVPEPEAREDGGSRWYLLFLGASLITGAASFIYEVAWIRMLSLVLGGSTHSFELMLSAFILGLAFGGLWIQRRIDRIAKPARFLAQVQVIMGLLALATLPVYGQTFATMRWLIDTLDKTDAGYAVFNLSSHVLALAVMLPATFCAGMTLPLITYLLIRRGHGERSIGAVYAANTLGAIIGVFFAIHLGMPRLGLKGLVTCGAALDIGLGLALIWGAGKFAGRRKPAMITAAGLGAVAAVVFFVHPDPYKMASGVYRRGELLTQGENRLVFHADGKTATVSVTINGNGGMSIRTNGKPDAAIQMSPGWEPSPDEFTMTLLATIPLALHPQAKTAANIGLGSGLSTHTLLSARILERVDTVEIESRMVEAARHFGPRVELAFKDPRSSIHIDDAKTFFSNHNRRYDIILSEPSNPWVSGVAGLFSEEFYRLANRHLNENGLFVQWVQLYEIDVNLVACVLKAVASNFADFAVYAPNDGDLMIVARKGGAIGSPDPRILQIPEIANALRRLNIASAQDIEIRRVGDKKVLGRLLETFPIRPNSDYYPVLDQNAARARFLQATAQELLGFQHEPLPVLEMLTGPPLVQEPTRVRLTHYFPKSEAAFTAMALRDHFSEDHPDVAYGEMPQEVREHARRLKELFYACGAIPEPDERMALLFGTAVRIVPYLRPHELDAVWEALASGPCAASLTPAERQWISLFKAAGKRDGAAMARDAQALLASGMAMPPAAVKYLVASGMLGHLAQGDRPEALRLWTKYGSEIFGSGEPDLLFRLLAAESGAR